MFNKLESVLMPIADKLGKNRVLIAIRDGFLITTPLLIVGSIFLLIANFPIPGWDEMMASVFGENWGTWFTNVSRATFNMTGLLTCVGTGYAFARELKGDKIQGAVVSLVAFVILTNTSIASIPGVSLLEGSDAAENGINGLAFRYIGADGIFMGLVCALSSVLIFTWVYKKGWTIKMPKGVPPMVAGPFEVLLPLVVNTILFIVLDQVIFMITGSGLTNLVFTIFSPLISATASLPSMLFIVVLTVVFWFFGIHGDNMVSAITTPIFTGNLVANLDAYNAGKDIPNIIAGNFTFIFGLAIVYLAILFNMNFICKNKRLRSLGKLAIPSSLFNINEPLVFGVPTVLNILTFIPSVICIIINVAIAYGATSVGFMNRTCMSVPWTLPAPLYAFLSTLDWRAIVVWIGLFIINVIIFIPFMKSYDKQMDIEEQSSME